MELKVDRNQLKKIRLLDSVKVVQYPNQTLPDYMIYAGENLFIYPKNNSNNTLLNVSFKNKTSSVIEVIVDEKDSIDNSTIIPDIDVVKGNVTLIFSKQQPIEYKEILSRLLVGDQQYKYKLEKSDGLKLDGTSIKGIPTEKLGNIIISATNPFNTTLMISMNYTLQDQMIPNPYLVFFLFLISVLSLSFLTVYFMSKPHHKIQLTTMGTAKWTRPSSSEEQDSGLYINRHHEEESSLDAVKSAVPSSIGKTLMSKTNSDPLDPIKVENIHLKPLSKYETFIGINMESNNLTATLVNGDDLPNWVVFDNATGLLMLHPSMNDVGNFIIIVRKNSDVYRIIHVLVDYNTFHSRHSDFPDSMTDVVL